MAMNATIHQFDIQLADSDRGVYEDLELRIARHPSEAEAYMVARVLAYALEFTHGIGFSRGLSTPDEPAIHVRDDTGALQAWIDIGNPEAARLHKAAKAAARVVVYTHKAHPAWLRGLADAKMHRADELAIFGFDRALIDGIVARLDRRMSLALSVSGGQLYATLGASTLEGSLTRLELPS